MPLTDREKKLVLELTNGSTYKEAADKLFMSLRTAENMRERLLLRLHARNTVHLIPKLFRNGFITILILLSCAVGYGQSKDTFYYYHINIPNFDTLNWKKEWVYDKNVINRFQWTEDPCILCFVTVYGYGLITKKK